MYIKDIKDIEAHDLRTRQVLELTGNLVEQGPLESSDLFGDFPDRVKDLLQVAGVLPNPLREVRWRLLNEDNGAFHTVYQFDLSPNNREIEQLMVKLRTRWRYEGESRLLGFDFKSKRRGDPAMAHGNSRLVVELGKAEYEFYHLPLLEDLYRLAEAKSHGKDETASVATPA